MGSLQAEFQPLIPPEKVNRWKCTVTLMFSNFIPEFNNCVTDSCTCICDPHKMDCIVTLLIPDSSIQQHYRQTATIKLQLIPCCANNMVSGLLNVAQLCLRPFSNRLLLALSPLIVN